MRLLKELIIKFGVSALVKWAVLISLAVVLANLQYRKGYKEADAKVRAEWAEERVQLAAATAAAMAKAQHREQILQETIEVQRDEYSKQVAVVERRHAAIVAGLRDRASQRAEGPTGLPETPGTAVGCTGAGLAGPDAEFLAGYATDAAKLAAALTTCQNAYEEVRAERQEN